MEERDVNHKLTVVAKRTENANARKVPQETIDEEVPPAVPCL